MRRDGVSRTQLASQHLLSLLTSVASTGQPDAMDGRRLVALQPGHSAPSLCPTLTAGYEARRRPVQTLRHRDVQLDST